MDSTAPEPKVIVPYRWSRMVSENAYPYPALSSSQQHGEGEQGNRKPDAVYYTSPSGRVLLSRKEVRRYLRETHSCKCYIDSNVLEDQNGVTTFAKTFNFDPSLGCYMMPPPSLIGGAPGPASPCLSWAAQYPANVITRELESLVRMLRRQLVHKPDEVHRTLCDNDKENNDNSGECGECGARAKKVLKKWLARINWDEVVISNSGRIYLTNLSSTQMKHLLYECVREGVVEPPMCARRQANETPEQIKRLPKQREREARQLEEKRQKALVRSGAERTATVVRPLSPRPQPSTPVRSVPLHQQAIQDFRQSMDRLVRSKSKNPVSVVPRDLSPKVEPEPSKASESKVRESKASKPKAPESKASEPKSSEPKAREPKVPKSKASKSKTSKPKVQEPKVPVRRASLSKIVETPRTLKTSAEPEVEVKKAARRERRNSQSRIKRASETPEQREVRLEKKREYNKRYRIKRRLSQMQEEDDELAKMNLDPQVGGGAPDTEDDNLVAKPKKLKVSFADEVVGAADHQHDPLAFENPFSSLLLD